MKKILFIFCMFIALGVKAQLQFVTSDLKEAKSITDSLFSNAKRNYLFHSESKSDKYNYKIVYKNQEDKTDSLNVYFQIRYIGANKDLETEGIPEYHFKSVYGNFLDLYPFWNKFIDSTESQEEIINKRATYLIKEQKRYLFQKKGEIWHITLHDVIK